MTSEDIARALGRLESKVDTIIERQSAGDARLNALDERIDTLESNYGLIAKASAIVVTLAGSLWAGFTALKDIFK